MEAWGYALKYTKTFMMLSSSEVTYWFGITVLVVNFEPRLIKLF